jgi:hypothetical protein
VLAIVFVSALTSIATACPTCKDSLNGDDPVQQAMASGYFYSIVFMMSMPFVILGTFGSFAYYSIRKAKLNRSSPRDDLFLD